MALLIKRKVVGVEDSNTYLKHVDNMKLLTAAHTVNLYMSLRCATGSHNGVCPSIVPGGVVNNQKVFGSFTLNSISGAHSCWDLNTILHPKSRNNI